MRKLTGKWYLKKFLFWYNVYVEIEYTITEPYSLQESPIMKAYVKAYPEDLLKLKIKVL